MNDALWTPRSLAIATGGHFHGTQPSDVHGISIDSRTVKAGDAFFAIKGDRLDGHDYVDKALNGGAALAVVERTAIADGSGQGLSLRPDKSYLVVEDVMDAMRAAASAARARSKGINLAVTGSVGKTSTKEALAHVLAPSGQVHSAVGSYNNHWGVPYTLAGLPEKAAFGVFEIGMNHAGEITPLTQLVQPDIAIVTTVAGAHLENFGSIDGIAHAKAEIFQGLTTGGTAIVNADNPYTPILIADGKACGVTDFIHFGEAAQADVRLLDVDLTPSHSDLVVSLFGNERKLRLGVPGRHVVQNTLAILAAVKRAGADLDKAIAALATLKAPEGRGVRHLLPLNGGTATLIDESYNANPTSMEAAFSLLKASQPEGSGRRLAVLGDMLELGDTAETLHIGLKDPLLAAGTDQVFLSGPMMAALWQNLPSNHRGSYQKEADDLAKDVVESVEPGDVILAKGSKGSRTSLVVKALLDRYKPIRSES